MADFTCAFCLFCGTIAAMKQGMLLKIVGVLLPAVGVVFGNECNTPAEPNDANGLVGLSSYLLYADLHNAELAAGYENWQAAVEQVPQAKTLPNPKLTYQLETQRNPHGQTFGIMQTLPWFGTIEARTEAASLMGQAAQKRYEAQRLKLFSQIKQSYYEYEYLGQQIEIARQNLEWLKYFERVTRAKYATSQIFHPDHLRAEIETANAEYEVLSLERSVEPLVAKLNALLNRPAKAALPVPAKGEFKEIPLHPDQIIAAVLKNNPDIQATQYDLAAAGSQVELAKKKFYPEIDIGVDALYQSEATMGPGAEPVYAKIGITLPIWASSYSAGQRQARANLRQIHNQKTQLQNDLAAQAQKTLYDIQIVAEKGKLYKQVLIPRSQEMLKAYESLYRSGGSDFLNLIDAQRTLLKSQLEYQKAISEYGQKIAELEMLAGTSLTAAYEQP
jgi:cobalt-zinc-cadmium efflux system outer membrane protein